MPSISIIGIGRVGGALAIALSDAGHTIDLLVHRGSETLDRIASRLLPTTKLAEISSVPQIKSDIVLITTADPDIKTVAERLAGSLVGSPVVLHTSGSLSSEVLSGLSTIGCSTGSMHPLVSISDALSGSGSFTDAYFCVEGDPAALEATNAIVESLGGRPFSIKPEFKSLYHAAAVTACGHLVALIDTAIEMLTECGIDRESAKDVLLPLIKSTIANLETQTPEQALTGSFARADVAAIERHVDSMSKNSPSDVRDIYLLLGERSLKLAEKNGADASDVRRIRESISIAKGKSEC
jgi:predicted short-subunit dehydrogenase-like oxidoreductase (DUF2520 family)